MFSAIFLTCLNISQMFGTDNKVTSLQGSKMFSLRQCHAVINRCGFRGFKLTVTHVTFGDDRGVGYEQGSSRRFWKHLLYRVKLSRHARRVEFSKSFSIFSFQIFNKCCKITKEENEMWSKELAI